MEHAPGLGDDGAHSESLEDHGREDRRLRIAADRDDGGREVAGAGGPQGVFVGGVELKGVCDVGGNVGDALLVPIDGQHLVAEPFELAGHRRARRRRCR